MRGYTLIELLITITITATLMTFGVNAYRKASDNQNVKSDTETILKTLTQAQKAATTGNKDCNSRYIGEKIQFIANSGQINITSVCSDDQGQTHSTQLNSMLFTETHVLTFRPLNQGVDLDTPDTLNLDYQSTTNSYRIEISKSGTIKSIGKL